MSSQEPKKGQEQTGLIVTMAGRPFSTAQAAGLVMGKKGLSPETHEIVQVQGGFAISQKNDLPPQQPSQVRISPTVESGAVEKSTLVAPAVEKVAEEKVFWGRFAPKSKESDSDTVVLSVNGEVVQMERDKLVPLPERYWDVARNGTYPQYKQLPGIPRKVVAKIRTYNFEIVREGTWAEFEAERKQGTTRTREAMEREQQMAEMANQANMAQV